MSHYTLLYKNSITKRLLFVTTYKLSKKCTLYINKYISSILMTSHICLPRFLAQKIYIINEYKYCII